MDWRKRGISLLIVLAIGLHAAPVVFYQGRSQTFWPFLAWAMYKNSRPPGPIEARRTRILGITAGGRQDPIDAGLVGLPRYTLREMYTQAMRGRDSTVAQQLISRLNAGRRDPFVEVRVITQTYTLSPSGVVLRNDPVISFRADSPPSN
jgi:hypothetical protein